MLNIDLLFRLNTLVLGIAIVIGTFFIRMIVETAAPSCKKIGAESTRFGRWWNGVIIYAIPVLLGVVLCVFVGEPITPVEAIKDGVILKKVAALFGAVVGWLSSFLYKVARKTLKKKTGVDLDPTASPTIPPLPPEDEADTTPPPSSDPSGEKAEEKKTDES